MKSPLGRTVASLVLVGTLVGSSAFGQKAAGEIKGTTVVATVNGEQILYSQLEPILKQTGPIPAALPEAQQREFQRESLAMVIDDLLLKQFLRKYVPTASAADIDRKMKELERELKALNKTLADFCRESHQTEANLRDNMGNLLQWSAYVKQQVNEAEVVKYYNDNRDFFDRVVVRASHIVLRVSSTAKESERQEAWTRLRLLRSQIVGGQLDFAEAAKKYSQCPTATNGGDVGSFPRKYVVDEKFARAAFALKTGEVSDVIQTDYGLHLIKVTERKPGKHSDFNKIKDEVREIYMEDLRLNLLAQLRKSAKIEIHLP